MEIIHSMTIRVRFAPSPTGFLHIGNARAALINWLFARHHQLNGKTASFMLRLDDTDLERSQDRFTTAIHTDLAWLGLTHDCYKKQSDRFERYGQIVEKLKEMGRLYPCFETPEELDFKRKRQLSRGEPPIYDRASLKLTAEQRENFIREGRQPHWRFLLEDKDIQWTDLVRGPTHFHGKTLSDPVLIRGDGAYLYTLTSVVDDIDFAVTHILRGEDHVTNTSVQIQLFEALGKNPAELQFGHTTLLMDAAGGALSKRLGSLSLGELRDQGIEPMAINSLLARLGTSHSVEPRLTLDELARDFDLSFFSRTPPRFDPADLRGLNHKLYQIMPYDDVKNRLNHLGFSDITPAVWEIIRGNIHHLSELKMWQDVCFGTIDPLSIPLSMADEKDYLKDALDALPPAPWDTATWALWTGALKEKTSRKGRVLFMPLRQALTGMDHGPEMKDLLPIIGYERALERLTQAYAGTQNAK